MLLRGHRGRRATQGHAAVVGVDGDLQALSSESFAISVFTLAAMTASSTLSPIFCAPSLTSLPSLRAFWSTCATVPSAEFFDAVWSDLLKEVIQR